MSRAKQTYLPPPVKRKKVEKDENEDDDDNDDDEEDEEVVEISSSSSSTKKKRKNLGGSSALDWFNPLEEKKEYDFVRQDLFEQLAKWTKRDSNPPNPQSPCLLYQRDTSRPKPAQKRAATSGDDKSVHPRIEPRQNTREKLARKFPQFDAVLPIKLMAAHVVMLKAKQRRPDGAPPNCPKDWLKSIARVRAESDAKWVASHLCHQKLCVNPAHIVWEPGWYNRARDNCPGASPCNNCGTPSSASCAHLPPCMAAHRAPVLDWKTLPAASSSSLVPPGVDGGEVGDDVLIGEVGDEYQVWEDEEDLVYNPDTGLDQFGCDASGLTEDGVTRAELRD